MRVMEVDKSKCLICEVSCHQKGLTFFRFPEEESRLKMWIKEISPLLDILKIQPNSLKENGRICARHFREKDFINCKQNSLVRNACPSLSVSNMSINFDKKNEMNEEVFEGEQFLKINQRNDGNEKDIFQCGRCKSQFEILSDFMDHKRYQCQSGIENLTKNSVQRSKILQSENLTLENVFVNNFENGISDEGTRTTDQIVKLINEEQSADKVVSLVVNDKLVIDPIDLPTQVLLTPSLCYNGVLKLNDADVTLPSHVIVSQQTDSSVMLNNVDAMSSLIITTDGGNSLNGGIVYTCPMQSSNTMAKEAEDAITFGELSNVVGAEGSGAGKEGAGEKEKEKETKSRLPCAYCGKTFEKPFNLQQHERVHTGERPFQCIVCGRAFTQKSNVRKHMLRHRVWPKGKQTLRLRAGAGVGEGEGLAHIDYSCQYCSSSFKSYAEHKKHLAVHSNIKVYRCIQTSCNETFGDLDEFLSHSKMHSSAEFRCHICLKVFTNLEELGVHQYDHDTTGKDKGRENVIKLKCKVCHARFKTAESLKNHLAVDTHHHECTHCKSVFSSERFLRRHLFTHMDTSHSDHRCPTCHKTFRTRQNLTNHSFVHLHQKPFTCDHCRKTFASKYRLKRHLAVHLDQFLECPFKKHLGCDRTFYRKDKLRDHVTTHSHCKLRSCRLCSKMYWTLSKLTEHMKREHGAGRRGGREALRCFACAQTFRKQKQFAQHHCTVEGRRTKCVKEEDRDRRQEETECESESAEAVSNIEIIMVPFGTNGRNLN